MAKDCDKPAKTLQVVNAPEVRFRAAIVGQDALGSSLLTSLLAQQLACEASAVRPAEVIPLLSRKALDAVVLSADFPGAPGAGYALAKTISARFPAAPMVMLLEHTSKEATLAALRCGIRGLFNRQQSLTALIACIEHVRNGSLWVGPGEATFLLEALRELPALGVLPDCEMSMLSMRELQVVRAAASGKTNRAIARELRLSEHTVKNYLYSAFEKLGVSSRIELLFYLTTRARSGAVPVEDGVVASGVSSYDRAQAL